MSSLRSNPTREFRPSRSTSSTGGTATAGPAAASRTRSTSRPPSAIGLDNGRTDAGYSTNSSRPGTVVGSARGAMRPATGFGASRVNAPASSASSGATTIGVKRKTRATTSGADSEQAPGATKRPALTSAFSAHVTQTSLNRQLLDAQTQVAKLQNTLLDKQREIDRLEADLRLVSEREEEEKGALARSEEELARKTSEYEAEVSSLRRKLCELEADHEDLDDAYSSLLHTSQSKFAALDLELTTRAERITLLEAQLKESETRANEEEMRAKALEELLEQMSEDGAVTEEDEGAEQGQEQDKSEVKAIDESRENTSMRIEIKEPESSVTDTPSRKDDTEVSEDEYADVDADGEAEEEEDFSMATGDSTPAGKIEVSNIQSGALPEANVFFEGAQEPEVEAYPDPGAPPPYAVCSPASASESASAARSRSASVASSQTGSTVSSRAMSLTLDGLPVRRHPHSPGTPLSITSTSRLDPLSHVRRRISLATPNRRRSSVGASSERQQREKDNEIIRAELARQTSHITSLETTNARLTTELMRLRPRAEGAEVLREEKRELERRIEAMEALRSRIAELETTIAEFARRESEWRAKLEDRECTNDENTISAKTPVGVTQELAALRKAHTVLLDEHGQLKATLRADEMELAGAREQTENVSRTAQQLQKEIERLQGVVSRKEKEHALLERDATFLRSLVSSYQREEAANTSLEPGEHAPSTEKLEQRILQLESLLSDYKSTIESLEKEVDRLQHVDGKAAARSQDEWNQLLNKASAAEEALNIARAEITSQSERIEELEQRLFELGGEIGAGRHIPPGTRILSLRQNPAQEWADARKEVLDRLKAENEALLIRLKELEDRGSSTVPSSSTSNSDDGKAQFVPRASYEVLKKEMEEKQTALEQKEKRLLRLQQVFSAKSVEFREAIESILGLKFAFYPNGQVRLTSVYDLSATFVFQPTESADKGGARLQLIATGDGGPQELEGLMSTWIRDEMCIPCFMSSVTLECYDKWKNEQRAAGLLEG